MATRLTSNRVYSYNSAEQTWSSLPECPYVNSSLAVVNGHLTAIGGRWDPVVTNHLHSFLWNWVEHFPPMPTKRCATAAVCSGRSLVVAGGEGRTIYMDAVEVMDTQTLQWSTASRLPFPLRYASATICQDRIYLLGYDTDNEPRSVLVCSMADLRQSCQSPSLGVGAWLKKVTLKTVWNQVADLPVHHSTCATLCGQLLAVGGIYDHDTAAGIHQYNTATDSWEVISHMPTARSQTLVAVLPGNKLMVVGRFSTSHTSDIVEIAPFKNKMYSN